MKKIRSIGVIWMSDIFSGGFGFRWEWMIGKFTFKGSISTVLWMILWKWMNELMMEYNLKLVWVLVDLMMLLLMIIGK